MSWIERVGPSGILAILLVLAAGCGSSSGPPEVSVPEDESHEVWPVQPDWQPGEDYPYDSATLERYEALFPDSGWKRSREERTHSGLLLAVHLRTEVTFVLIPGGEFLMGSPNDEPGREIDEGPRHLVTVPAFLLSRTECRQKEWERGGGENLSEWRLPANPLENVTWESAQEWCDGLGLRLPSEAEWEYACRARSPHRWFFGDDESELRNFACYFGNAGEPVTPAGSLRPNAFGLHDMLGNVSEWCADTWHDDYVRAPRDGSAWTADGGPARVFRGGDWFSTARTCRSAARRGQPSSLGGSHIGLRPAASLR